MSAHTPGPWKAVDVRGTVRLVTGTGNALIELKPASAEGGASYDANARLIAAAPEMLEALRGLLANAPKPKRIKDDFSYTLYLEAARTAILKAEGSK